MTVDYPTFVLISRSIANGMASAAIGYVCGYTEAKYTNHPNPHQRAREEMVYGAILGFAIQSSSALQRYRLWIGIGLVLASIGTAPDIVVVGIRATCIMAEFSTLAQKGIGRRGNTPGRTPVAPLRP